MKHIIFVLIIVIILISGFSGVIALKQVEPYQKTLVGNDFVGKAVPGSTLQLVFSKENEKYDSLKITNTLPAGFSVAVKEEFESFKVIILIPENSVNAQYKLGLLFSNANDVLADEKTEVYFTVDNELLFVSMDNFSQQTYTNEPAYYQFTLINNSDSSATFIISSSLPTSWYSQKAVIVEPKLITKQIIQIIPGVSGERKFIFSVDYSGKQKSFDVLIKSEPTLESKFSSALNGLPFYSFSLIPNYLLNGILSLFF